MDDHNDGPEKTFRDTERNLRDRIEALEAENERLREALNPTNRRQAEYMNLFHWSEPDFDECGGRTTRHVSMPWPKIKQALAAIYARAALEEVTTYD